MQPIFRICSITIIEYIDHGDEQQHLSVPAEGHDEHDSEAQPDETGMLSDIILISRVTDLFQVTAAPEQFDEPPAEEDYGQQELLEFEDDDPALGGTSDLKQESGTHRDVDSVSINSGKRTYDQLELEDEQDNPPSSPGMFSSPYRNLCSDHVTQIRSVCEQFDVFSRI